jgi:hypothetical protein
LVANYFQVEQSLLFHCLSDLEAYRSNNAALDDSTLRQLDLLRDFIKKTYEPNTEHLTALWFDTDAYYGEEANIFPIVELSFLIETENTSICRFCWRPSSFTTYRTSWGARIISIQDTRIFSFIAAFSLQFQVSLSINTDRENQCTLKQYTTTNSVF